MLKKILLCSSVFLWGLTPGNADEHFPFLGEVSKDAVNVRAGANTNFESLDKMGKGSPVVVTGRHYEWYKVQLAATVGAYVRADYIKEQVGGVGEIIGDRVNLRAKANSDASSLGQLAKGEAVKLVAQEKGWWRIEPPPSAEGWVHADFIRLVSAQVPADLQRSAVLIHPIPVPVPVHDMLAITGKVQPTSTSPDHYQLMVNEKAQYCLDSMPHLDHFAQTTVTVEGALTTSNNTDSCPVLHIHKIALVL